MDIFCRKFSSLLILLSLLLVSQPQRLSAQVNFDDSNLFPNFSLGGIGRDDSEPAKWKAIYVLSESGEGRLDVTATIGQSWHIYSVTQEPGGPLKTSLTIESPETVKLSGEFVPDEPPLKSVSPIFKGITIEEHEGVIVWSAPIHAPKDFRESITVKVDAQVCKPDGACIPIEETIEAKFSGMIQSEKSTVAMDTPESSKVESKENDANKPFRDDKYEVQWIAKLTPSTVAPGERATLSFTAKPDPSYHVYPVATDGSDSSTNFVIREKSGLLFGMPETQSLALPVDAKLLPGVFYHKGDVTWSIPITIPKDAKAGTRSIEGLIGYQACTDKSCQPPKALSFKTTLSVASATITESISSISFATFSFPEAMDIAAETQWVDDIKLSLEPTPAEKTPEKKPATESGASHSPTERNSLATTSPITIDDGSDTQKKSFPVVLTFAFLGGIILNFMPCVLPVVGLKVMSFVQQAGADRKRVFLLNLFYAGGILAVFALLTALAVLVSFSWGEQFTYFPVRLGLTILMFAMALSYLGVWEIPAPGMAGGKMSQDLQKREGYTGAFFKGAFATVLSTPCSGPFLGAIFGMTIALTAPQTVVVMMTIGLGMAIPYLLIGVRPSLVAWLPKPGDWMETLKEFLAFLFLATVAFFFNQFSDDHKVPVFVTLIAVWFGCWIIGKVPNWADIEKRLMAWVSGVGIAALIGFLAFQYLGAEPESEPGVKAIAWVQYDEAALDQYQAEGRTVLIDFTAKWCVNCIVNYNVAINTEATRKVIEELDAVPMLADWTDRNDEIKAKLAELESRSIPVLAIYPGANPNQPIVLRDLVSQTDVVNALKKAGPSVESSSIASENNAVDRSTVSVH